MMTCMKLTPELVADIKQHLDKGMAPEDVANYIGRIADLDLGDIMQIKSAAYAISRGETP